MSNGVDVKWKNFGRKHACMQFMKLRSQLIPLDEDMAELAGKLSLERKKRVEHWGMADSIVLATARLGNHKIITGDEHFRDLEEAMMIK